MNVSVLGIITVNVPTALASGTAAPAYNDIENLASLSATTNLSLGSLVSTGTAPVGTNVIADSASATYASPATASATATSTVNDLTTNLGLVGALVNLLHISATELTSTSTASAPGGTVNLVGTSQVLGLTVTNGVVGLGGTSVTVNASALASTPVNNLILSAAGLSVYTNYQTATSSSINTAALAINLNNFAFGTGLLTGTILFADSQAAITGAVPEPATWAMMLLGFGLTGMAVRRKQVLALA